MGYRANVVTTHRTYGSQIFADWEVFIHDFIPAMRERGIEMTANDAEDFFEVDKEELQQYVNLTPSNDEESPYTGTTNKELNQLLQTAINETTDNYVAFEWF